MFVLCARLRDKQPFTRIAKQCRTICAWRSCLKDTRANSSFKQPHISVSTGRLRQSELSTQARSRPKDAIIIPETCHSDFWGSSRRFCRSTNGRLQAYTEEALRKDEHEEVATGQAFLKTPSRRLIDALQSLGANALIPRKHKGKVDLSFFNVREYEENLGKSLPHNVALRPRLGDYRLKLSDVLAGHIKHVEPLLHVTIRNGIDDDGEWDDAVRAVYDTQALNLLRTRGYDVDDVCTWSWIATSSSADQAAARFGLAVEESQQRQSRGLPVFLLLFILRCRSLSATSLRLLLNMSWRTIMHAAEDDDAIPNTTPNEQSRTIMVFRLLRHARKVSPGAMEEIARLMIEAFKGFEYKNASLSQRNARTLCHLYNRALSLFAQPTSLHPFRSIAMQQRAQFRLLRRMIEIRPQLPVTREGFRALVTVQVAHKKTESEREWARRKALSWPPWKEDKLGIDIDAEMPGRRSRAVEVLERMNEAGYSDHQFEKIARIFAGWDTDKSPTIQRRTLLTQSPILLHGRTLERDDELMQDRDQNVWAARISATRTIKEAWACFCSYEKACQTRHASPYSAMFERLFHAGRDVDENEYVVPGDGRETYPEPTSPHDFVYVPTDPPTPKELFGRMLRDNVRPHGRLLAELLDHATDLRQGFECIEYSGLAQEQKDALTSAHFLGEPVLQERLSQLPGYVFASFLRLLVRFPRSFSVQLYKPNSLPCADKRRPLDPLKRVKPLTYALRLVDVSQTQYGPAWYSLFSALKHQTRFHGLTRTSVNNINSNWDSLRRLLQAMSKANAFIDFQGFQEISPILEEVVLSNHRLAGAQRPGRSKGLNLRQEGAQLAQRLFQEIATGKGKFQPSSWLASTTETKLLSVPSAAVLPSLVRVLGNAEEYEAQISLLRWMHRHHSELASVNNELIRGRKLMRRALVAIRVYLERCWTEDRRIHAAQPQFSQRLGEAFRLVEDVESWGGWPSDEEVSAYLAGRQTWVVRMREAAMARQLSNHEHSSHSPSEV